MPTSLFPPFSPCFTPSGPQTHFPHSALWRPLEVWFVWFRGVLNCDPFFSERLSLLETPLRGHYDPSERIKTLFMRLKLTHARLLCFWKAGAWETVHKYAFSSHWLPGHFVSLQTLFPFKCVSFLCIFPLSFMSPSRLAICKSFQWQKGWRKEDRPPKHRCKWTVVFLSEGFRMIKTLSAHRTLLYVTEDYPSLRLLTLINKRRKRTQDWRAERQATEKMSIFAWSLSRETLCCFSHSGVWRSQNASHSTARWDGTSPLRGNI